MIQANELRINNLVKVKISNDARIYTIVNINGLAGTVGLDGVRQGEVISTEKIKPIKLTEEILLKCGFEKATGKHGDYFYHKVFDGFRIWQFKYTPNYDVGRKSDEKTYWIAGGIKSLHQLQNLFYALTYEELEVNL